MTWFTLPWAIFLSGVLFSSASGAIGLNHRKNGVLNLGLIGLMYLGSMVSSILSTRYELNPYWSIPIGILAGALLNIGLNYAYIDLLRRFKSPIKVSIGTIVPFIVLYLVGNGFSLNFFSVTGYIPMTYSLRLHDFTLFTAPGVLIVGGALFLFSTIIQMIIGPVSDEGPRGFDKWDMFVYALSGVTACLSGALYPFWFSGPAYLPPVISLGGALLGGFEKRLNPLIGGFLAAAIITGTTSQQFLGIWISERPALIGLALILLSLPLYPRGVIGSVRRVLEYDY